MLDNKDHVFHFSNPKALANAAFNYTSDELTQARAALDPWGPNIPDWNHKELLRLQGRQPFSAALACALIEHGFSAREEDMTGQIRW